jgi:hypothetical protein
MLRLFALGAQGRLRRRDHTLHYIRTNLSSTRYQRTQRNIVAVANLALLATRRSHARQLKDENQPADRHGRQVSHNYYDSIRSHGEHQRRIDQDPQQDMHKAQSC